MFGTLETNKCKNLTYKLQRWIMSISIQKTETFETQSKLGLKARFALTEKLVYNILVWIRIKSVEMTISKVEIAVDLGSEVTTKLCGLEFKG